MSRSSLAVDAPQADTDARDDLEGRDAAACVRLAASPDSSPQLLRALATDSRLTIRAALALNPAVPDAVDATLATDTDARVRQLLARKLATLIPGMSQDGRLQLRQQAMATLSLLVEDEAERVRSAIADLVKDMPQAPRDLILRLARDTAVPVSEPVLRLSPVLTVADLLALLASPPTRATATAIAAREGLQPEVADAIAAGGDTDAIRVLLENGTAQLREAALDALIARASHQESWHEGMVRRPKLSGRAANALSEFVTTHLLAVLADRTDLPPDITDGLKRRLSEAGRSAKGEAGGSPTPPDRRADVTAEEALSQAHQLRAAGRLDEAALRGAALRGDAKLSTAMLAVAADVAVSVVERAASMRSAKGVVSLVWLAGMSMELAIPLQTLVGRVAPGAVLRSLDETAFPLAVDEMRWQIDLLKQMGR